MFFICNTMCLAAIFDRRAIHSANQYGWPFQRITRKVRVQERMRKKETAFSAIDVMKFSAELYNYQVGEEYSKFCCCSLFVCVCVEPTSVHNARQKSRVFNDWHMQDMIKIHVARLFSNPSVCLVFANFCCCLRWNDATWINIQSQPLPSKWPIGKFRKWCV